MFRVDELEGTLANERFIADLTRVREALAGARIGLPPLFDDEASRRLSWFVESVLASAPLWAEDEGAGLCGAAAEICELLAIAPNIDVNHERYMLRGALLYDLAGQPMMAAAAYGSANGVPVVTSMFQRRGGFASLKVDAPSWEEPPNPDQATAYPVKAALGELAVGLGEFEQSAVAEFILSDQYSPIARAVSRYDLDLSLTDTQAFKAVVERRALRATRRFVRGELLEKLTQIAFPAELWTSQVAAVSGGLLDDAYDAWSLAAPTGTGKTFLTRLVIVESLGRRPETKVLYIVPSKALVYQVASTFTQTLGPLGISTVAVTPQIVDLASDENERVDDADILVLTPEKADLLLRLGPDALGDISLVVIDEAHHIESSTRGVLLELYLYRLRRLYSGRVRYIFLSAVAPNVGDLADWMGSPPIRSRDRTGDTDEGWHLRDSVTQ